MSHPGIFESKKKFFGNYIRWKLRLDRCFTDLIDYLDRCVMILEARDDTNIAAAYFRSGTEKASHRDGFEEEVIDDNIALDDRLDPISSSNNS